jgi:hypothetical protein
MVRAAAPGLSLVTAQQQQVPNACCEEQREAQVLHDLDGEVTPDGETGARETHYERALPRVVADRGAQDRKIGDQGHENDGNVPPLELDEPKPRAGEYAAQNTQARRADRALENRQSDRARPEPKTRRCGTVGVLCMRVVAFQRYPTAMPFNGLAPGP